MPGVTVEIVDDDNVPLPPGKEGILRISSETGVNEYLGDPEETARAFRDGWFYPGDIGYLTADNMLVISGRAKSIINIGGEKINPEKVEEILSAHSSVHQVAVTPVPGEGGLDELCALIVPRSALVTHVLQEFCREKLPRKLVPSRFIAVSELPRNEMGKIERFKLPDLVRSKLN
jgi:acyl-CoA synthetase (AMP-forming)/AMP-acid ligase II